LKVKTPNAQQPVRTPEKPSDGRRMASLLFPRDHRELPAFLWGFTGFWRILFSV
jgi:hypothetical protein